MIYAEKRQAGVTNTLHFLLDENGTRIGFVHNGNKTYYYRFNLQGDVTGIYNESGTLVVQYTYDAWGKLEPMTGDQLIGLLNPIRYRGYYYDIETGLYYLQSRYYDPETCRFISADAYLSTGQGVLGCNMYAYCLNNPNRYVDPTGMVAVEILLGGSVCVVVAMVLIAMVFDPDVNATIQNGIDDLWKNVVNLVEFTKCNFASDVVINQAIPKITIKEKSSVKEKEVEKITTTQSKTTTTYYHLTTPEYALIIQYSSFLQGSILEGGYVFAWKMKPNKYAIQNSGARGTVLISFETTAAFVIDPGISDPRVMRYGPVRSALPGPVPISNVQILKGNMR